MTYIFNRSIIFNIEIEKGGDNMSIIKTDKMRIVEIFIEEPIQKFLRREYRENGISITKLTEILNKKSGTRTERSTVWKWLKIFNIRRKVWK